MDRDLVVAAQRGDQSAFVDLIRPRARRLLTMARQIVGNPDPAEDALQDALVLAWRDLRGLRDPDRFDACALAVWPQQLDADDYEGADDDEDLLDDEDDGENERAEGGALDAFRAGEPFDPYA